MKGVYFLGLALSFFGAASYVVSLPSQMVLRVTSILLPIAFICFFLAIVHFLLSIFQVSGARKQNLLLSAKTIIFLFILVELILRLTGILQTYSEKSWGGYAWIASRNTTDSWFYIQTPNSTITAGTKEFEFHRDVNSLGLSDVEIPPKKDGEIRIMALGDSFTEGVGVSYDSTWVKKLGVSLNQQFPKQHISTVNAGIGGSDPVYEYILFQEKLVQYAPDLVIMLINSSDVYDIAYRGGFERFNADGTTDTGEGRLWWEWIYASSHVVRVFARVFMGYNSYLVSGREIKEKKAALFVKTMLEVNGKLEQLSGKGRFRVLYVLHPITRDFRVERYYDPEMLDLLDSLKQRDLPYVDIRTVFDNKNITNFDEAQSFYWPIDQHFNQKGYNLVCTAIRDEILRRNWLVGEEKEIITQRD